MTSEEFVKRAIDITRTLDSDFASWALEELVDEYEKGENGE